MMLVEVLEETPPRLADPVEPMHAHLARRWRRARAVQLLLGLLTARAADREAAGTDEVVPIPILFPVAGWDFDAHRHRWD
ncbi:hypothetical protein [Nonomuraea sp. LPB2021202275-12-8]|uniref:hypothetical protein n=1 Tax=Nonomuraea sp. LPB2021202275-12-8 TaxID=3120159 RepID=UPI00300D788F